MTDEEIKLARWQGILKDFSEQDPNTLPTQRCLSSFHYLIGKLIDDKKVEPPDKPLSQSEQLANDTMKTLQEELDYFRNGNPPNSDRLHTIGLLVRSVAVLQKRIEQEMK